MLINMLWNVIQQYKKLLFFFVIDHLASVGGERRVIEVPGEPGRGSGSRSLAGHFVGPVGAERLELRQNAYPQGRHCGAGEVAFAEL